MAYTAAIGEKGATVKQVRKMEQLLDAKIGGGGGGGDTYYTINSNVSDVELFIFTTNDGSTISKNVAVCTQGGETFTFEFTTNGTITKNIVTV